MLAASMSDVDELGRLGYAQELIRRMGGFSSFAVSFSIISVLTGCITAYADAFGAGGPATLGIGWPLVSAGTLLVALAMAELASAFPTAGALKVEVLRLVARGFSNSKVAAELVLSPRTVHAHLRSVYRKLDVHSRAAAARSATELGLS